MERKRIRYEDLTNEQLLGGIQDVINKFKLTSEEYRHLLARAGNPRLEPMPSVRRVTKMARKRLQKYSAILLERQKGEVLVSRKDT